jgi:N-acetylated-alpha-linked acidic dipeptidase
MTIVDVAVSGSRYNIHGSPSLAHLIRDTAGAVPHPTLANMTLWDARLDEGPFKKEGKYLHDYKDSAVVMEGLREEARIISEELPVTPLGSGSDYTGDFAHFQTVAAVLTPPSYVAATWCGQYRHGLWFHIE